MRKIKIIICFLLIVFITITIITFINNYFGQRVELYAYQKAQSNATTNITTSITANVLDLLDNKIFENDNNNIIINTKVINEVMKNVNEELNTLIIKMENESIFIPYSILISEVLFTNSKSGINVKAKPISSFTTDVISEVKEYGINNSVVSINLVVKIKIELLIPFNKKQIDVLSTIPLAMIICEGDIPPGILYSN